ncbi:MAG: hypothetical protein H8E86_06635 [Planctomycetes bacterium]|nr:hypothetical protein [Planctomycetota bacterium]
MKFKPILRRPLTLQEQRSFGSIALTLVVILFLQFTTGCGPSKSKQKPSAQQCVATCKLSPCSKRTSTTGGNCKAQLVRVRCYE